MGDICKIFRKNVWLFETHPFTNSRFDKYSIRKSMIPKFLSLSWVKKILNTGKSINFLRCVCDDSTSNITNREKGIKSSKNLLKKCHYRKGHFIKGHFQKEHLPKRPLPKSSLSKRVIAKKVISKEKATLLKKMSLPKRPFTQKATSKKGH